MRRAYQVVVVMGGVLLAPGSASAVTTPVAGAVALPSSAKINLPFKKGAVAYISSGYGPDQGSSYHINTNSTSTANDYYALDFHVQGKPNYGYGEPVVSIAKGTVVKAGWGTVGWASYGRRVVVRHEFGGVVYHSLYAHLSEVSVAEGATVQEGTLLGKLGGSSNESDNGTTPHLHFALHHKSLIGGSGTGGSYGGNACVPEPFGTYENLKRGMALEVKEGGEVPPDVPCTLLPPEGGILDDLGPCFSKHGTAAYWKEASQGHANHLFYNIATSDPMADNWARWSIVLAEAGSYRVSVYTDNSIAMSTQASYQVRHAEKQVDVKVNQAAANGWRELGTYDFKAGGDQWVQLGDNTGEPVGEKKKLVFDAVRLEPAGTPPPTDGGAPDTTVPDSGQGGGAHDSQPPGDSSTPTLDAGSTDAETGPGVVPVPVDATRESGKPSQEDTDFDEETDSSGCSCAYTRSSFGSVAWLLALAAVVLGSRRRWARN